MAVNKQLIRRMNQWIEALESAEKNRVLVSAVRVHDLYPSRMVGGRLEKELFAHQKAFHEKKTPSGKEPSIVVLVGGYGSGKSLAASVEMVYLLKAYNGIRIAAIAPYNYYFYEFIWPTFQKVLPFDDPFVENMNMGNQILTCRNGSQIFFKAYDDPEKIKGWEAHVIWIEEAAQLGENNDEKALAIYRALLGRLRAPTLIDPLFEGFPSGQDYPRRMYMTFNPAGHNWIWKELIRGNPYGDEGLKVVEQEPCKHLKGREIEYFLDRQIFQTVEDCRKTCQFCCSNRPLGQSYKVYEKEMGGSCALTIMSSTLSNPTLPYDYIARMAATYDRRNAQRFIEGSFAPLLSLVYDATWFSCETHVVELESVLDYYDVAGWERDFCLKTNSLPPDWRVIVGIDVGGPKSPWACEFYAISPDDTLFAFDEIYQAGLTWDDIAMRILNKTKPFRYCEFYLDPMSLTQRSGPALTSVKDTFERYGIHCQTPLSANIYDGILAVRTLLKRDTSRPCPFLEDKYDEKAQSYAIGKARLYYIEGATPFNLKEKAVWRFNVKREHTEKEELEGLSAKIQEKPVDRDDHAQRAEHFAVLGARITPQWTREEIFEYYRFGGRREYTKQLTPTSSWRRFAR